MKNSLLTIVLISSGFLSVFAQTRTYTAHKTAHSQIKIDGIFNEDSWNTVQWSGNFTQYEPNEGDLPSEKSEFKIIYDENNLYIAFKVYDSEPNKIEKRLSRRDSWDGDVIVVQLDSYYDKKTAFVFGVNAAGVRNDAVITNDDMNEEDDTWDPIWSAKTCITDFGWTAEMKIPLSQLRFGKKEHQVWGFEAGRFIFRRSEWSIWQPISKETSGWVSRFGELNGLKDLKPKRQIEIAPYVSSGINIYEAEEGNPYADGSDLLYNGGIDGKIGISNDLTLDFAVNPDFGQVEADPSEVNLSAYETFFSEKRPFFVEGNNITNYQITPGGNPWSSDNLFYSRRVGRSPQYSVEDDLNENEYAQVPLNTGILGALKLTGKTKKGFSLGIIESITNNVYAKVSMNDEERTEIVEPLTNYFAGRFQKDMNEGNTIVGSMLTSTNRFINDEQLYFLNDNAYTGGLDFRQYFKDKKYYISTTLAGSHIQGSTEAILLQQESSRRYYQRPDADYMVFDSTRTSLSGWGGNFLFAKQASKGFSLMANVTWRSPGLELNDMGYMRQANSIFQFIWAGYRITEPFSIFRSIQFNGNQWSGWDFGGINTFNGGNINAWFQFKNLWSAGFHVSTEFNNIDNTILRGGSAMKIPGNLSTHISLETNPSKKLTFSGYSWYTTGYENAFKGQGIYAHVKYHPFNFISMTISQEYSSWKSDLQYLTSEEVAGEQQYIFGNIDQKTFSLTARLDINITPDFTIQYYGAPFISAAQFFNYKKITDPFADNYLNRFHIFTDSEIDYISQDETFGIKKHGSSAYDLFFDNPDFNYQQFRSNLVLRWEFKPGSLLYLVWSEEKTESYSKGNFNFGEDFKNMFQINSNDTFLIKFSYRFIL